MAKITIHKATENDAQLILDLIVELAIYEKAEQEVKTNVAEIKQTLFSPGASAYGLIAKIDNKPVGYAVYFYNYSTWLGKNGIYLEDVYITPESRGQGAGKALLKHIAKIAVEQNCGRFEWCVLDWNKPSIEFYDSLAAKPQNEWITYRLTGSDLLALAES